MPRYFFHSTDGRRVCPDAEGLELRNDAAARKEGRLMARDLWSEPADGVWTIRVTDQTSRTVATLAATPPSKVRQLAWALDDWLKRVCGHPDAAVSSPPPSPAGRPPIDPSGWSPERILRSRRADHHETADKA